MWIAIVKIYICVQLEVTESQDHNACRKVCNLQGAWLIANEGGLGHHVCHVIGVPQVSHRLYGLKVLHAERNRQQARYSHPVVLISLNTVLSIKSDNTILSRIILCIILVIISTPLPKSIIPLGLYVSYGYLTMAKWIDRNILQCNCNECIILFY
jgi:hypothetical protein